MYWTHLLIRREFLQVRQCDYRAIASPAQYLALHGHIGNAGWMNKETIPTALFCSFTRFQPQMPKLPGIVGWLGLSRYLGLCRRQNTKTSLMQIQLRNIMHFALPEGPHQSDTMTHQWGSVLFNSHSLARNLFRWVSTPTEYLSSHFLWTSYLRRG